ncbi:hypothetical protein EJB05_21123 [Eragrostis curvula]|uniref:NAC domain-containing protein n=1 Tax=Eragrostis curvula TaxID=38414 RepID=A0A5J9V0L5_9POAL|nr:hypothetical protein EJB05_21123 [Eragrostis curvula]
MGGKGVVLLRRQGPQVPDGAEDEPGHGVRVLEGDGQGQGDLQGQGARRHEEDARLLHGRAPRGGKTGWVMHEYRLEGKHAANGAGSSSLLPSIKAATSKDEWVLCRVFKKNIELPSPVAGGKRSAGSSCMGMADVGPSSMSMADELAACTLPPLMDVSGSGGGHHMSLSAAAAHELPPPAHVTCFSNNALEGQFLNPPFLLPSAPAPADHLATASAASPFLAGMQMQYDGGMVQELLQQEGGGGWYSKLGERERLSGASQDTGLTSEVNPAEISSSRQHMSHEVSLWDY